MAGSDSTLLRDVLVADLRLVICGAALGTVSAQKKLYYAGPGNRLWAILAEVGLTPRQLAPAEYLKLLEFGIGLTDIIKDQSGADRSLSFGETATAVLENKILRYHPKLLCFNGKRAASAFLAIRPVSYGLQSQRVGNTRLYVAPSTSGAARRWWDASHWTTMAALVMASAAEW